MTHILLDLAGEAVPVGTEAPDRNQAIGTEGVTPLHPQAGGMPAFLIGGI
jgi:hypothetical protein